MATGRERPNAGRKAGFKHTQIARERIRVGMLLGRLQRHVKGDVEMSPTQIRAAEILLKKALPDLTSIEHSGAIEHRSAVELTDEQLAAIASGSSAGIVAAPTGADEPAGVH
jgi:hypothetical protein